VAAWTLWLVLGGCVGSAPAQALYAGPAEPTTEVAELHGLVEYVDGQRVSGGKFALLPGCHTVQPPTKSGQSSPQGAAWTTLPELHFSIMMVAGHRYQIAVRTWTEQGPGGPCSKPRRRIRRVRSSTPSIPCRGPVRSSIAYRNRGH
jgi:hypothetical protein